MRAILENAKQLECPVRKVTLYEELNYSSDVTDATETRRDVKRGLSQEQAKFFRPPKVAREAPPPKPAREAPPPEA